MSASRRRRVTRRGFGLGGGAWTLIAVSLTGFMAFGAVLPVLPVFVRDGLGGDAAVGIVVGGVTISAVGLRPFAGRWVESYGRRRPFALGLALMAVAGALYMIPAGLAGLIVARLVHGAGDAIFATAGMAWLIDLVPRDRRAHAVGLFGVAVWVGLSLGPALGQSLYELASFSAVWLTAAVLPAAGMMLVGLVPGGSRAPASLRPRPPGRLIPAPVVLPGIALMCVNVGYGVLSAFVVLLMERRGVGHGALVFSAFGVAVAGARLAVGWVPDVIGPRTLVPAAAAAEATGLALIAVASSLPVALAGAVTMGAGFSMIYPSLMVVAVQRTGDGRPGVAVGAMGSFFDVGVGVGAPVAGLVAAAAGYAYAFAAAAAAALLAGALGRSLTARPGTPREPQPVTDGSLHLDDSELRS